MKIGVMFGSPETTTGGRALKFYASVRMDIRRIGAIKEGSNAIGNRVRVKVVKTKMAPPFKEVELDIMFGFGISYEADILDIALEADLISKIGSWYSYGDERLGQGRENTKIYLHDNPDMLEGLSQKVKEHLGLLDSPDSNVTEDKDAEEKKENE